MHRYLPAIGFAHVRKNTQFQQILQLVVKSPDTVKKIDTEDGIIVVMTKEFSKRIGIAVVGEEDQSGNFLMEYHYPYVISDFDTIAAECSIERESGKEAYNVLCDDYRLGMNLIFSMNNFAEYLKNKIHSKDHLTIENVCLSALSVSGRVLLPTSKSRFDYALMKKKEAHLKTLFDEAQKGNQDAIDELTLEDINLNNKVSRLIGKYDLYTIISTFIIPCGAECNQYTMMGDIVRVRTDKNSVSSEKLYVLDVLCNDIPIEVVINSESLLGEPAIGRRFKGDVWLQGSASLK